MTSRYFISFAFWAIVIAAVANFPLEASSIAQGQGQDATAEAELQTGTALTSKGLFSEAIPHLLAARGSVSNEYAASFNLALCYVGSRQFQQAIQILNELQGGAHQVDVENLLAQAYIGNAQPQEGLASFKKAAALAPQNEKLYRFVADACMDRRDYELGLKVIEIGLHNLPQSARLHYERAIFLIHLDELDRAKPEFILVSKLAPESEIGYLAGAHEELIEGDVAGAVRTARDGAKKGYGNHPLLTLLGEALIRSGLSPGQAEFAEAQAALEKAVKEQPNDPASHIALSSLYLMSGQLDDAIMHLEKARQVGPDAPAIYANLAKAYRRRGDLQQSQAALAVLEKLNREQVERISSAAGDHKMDYAGRGAAEEAETSH